MLASPLITAVRAIATEFARRLFVPVLVIFTIVAVFAIILVAWCVTLNAWWWLLLVPLVVISLIISTALLAVGLAIRFLTPNQSKAQRVSVRGFVDSLEGVSEVTQTPKVFILFRLVKDIVRPSERSFISSVATNVTSLKPAFTSIVESFRSH